MREMVTVRIEYGGMRVENDVERGQEWTTYGRMIANHKLQPFSNDPMRGKSTITGSRYTAQFIPKED